MCHLSGSNHPSSPTCPTPLIYPSPLLRVSSCFHLSLFLYCPSFFLYICPISCPCLVLSSLLLPLSFEPAISSFICFLPSPPDSRPSHHLACAILVAPIIPALPPAPPLLFILPLSCASLPLSFVSLIFYCPSFFLYICPISFPCLVLSSLLLPLSFEPAISSIICFLPSPLTASPLITWHAPS